MTTTYERLLTNFITNYAAVITILKLINHQKIQDQIFDEVKQRYFDGLLASLYKCGGQKKLLLLAKIKPRQGYTAFSIHYIRKSFFSCINWFYFDKFLKELHIMLRTWNKQINMASQMLTKIYNVYIKLMSLQLIALEFY